MTRTDCLFCRFASPEFPLSVSHKFKHCYAAFDSYPVSRGHILFIPYEHVVDWFAASHEIRLDIMHAIDDLKIWLDQKFAPSGYNIGMNCGKAAGQTIPHLHVHLIPRYDGDMEDPRGGVRGVIPQKQKY
jgi:diadenosine tetraphosphate (Ap4A) HIT family hydrolase